MSVVNMSSSRAVPEPELAESEQLAISLSARLARLHFEELPAVIVSALDQLARSVSADACRLIEFTDDGSVAREHVSGKPGPRTPERNPPTPCDAWLFDQLARGEPVVISQLDDLPTEAVAARAHARRSGGWSVLGMPALVAGQVVSALVVEGGRSPRRCPMHLAGRLQLI